VVQTLVFIVALGRAPLATMKLVKAAFALLVASSLFAQSPVKIGYACTPEDIDAFGLPCSAEEPCAVFLELSSVEAVGAKIFIAGNLHTERTTLYSVLLVSEDNGATWNEPQKRMRAAALEQIQFVDFANGWISGQIIEPLPKDPFLLITIDGGKTWRQKALFEESRFGSVAQFWFDSRTAGELAIDHSAKHEVYRTNTGGENWELEEVTTQPVHLKSRRENSTWRLRADGKAHHLERRGTTTWEPVASFVIHIADCK
jgi:photosystem II stability/assembly factor-like uncharacterized protein